MCIVLYYYYWYSPDFLAAITALYSRPTIFISSFQWLNWKQMTYCFHEIYEETLRPSPKYNSTERSDCQIAERFRLDNCHDRGQVIANAEPQRWRFMWTGPLGGFLHGVRYVDPDGICLLFATADAHRGRDYAESSLRAVPIRCTQGVVQSADVKTLP